MSKKQLIGFQIDSDKMDALDALAKVLGRDRAYLLNEAVGAYFEFQQRQFEHIQASIQQADKGGLIMLTSRKWGPICAVASEDTLDRHGGSEGSLLLDAQPANSRYLRLLCEIKTFSSKVS